MRVQGEIKTDDSDGTLKVDIHVFTGNGAAVGLSTAFYVFTTKTLTIFPWATTPTIFLPRPGGGAGR